MALIFCKKCGKEFEGSEKKCHNCGSKKHRGFFVRHPIFTTILLIWLVINVQVGIAAYNDYMVKAKASGVSHSQNESFISKAHDKALPVEVK